MAELRHVWCVNKGVAFGGGCDTIAIFDTEREAIDLCETFAEITKGTDIALRRQSTVVWASADDTFFVIRKRQIDDQRAIGAAIRALRKQAQCSHLSPATDA